MLYMLNQISKFYDYSILQKTCRNSESNCLNPNEFYLLYAEFYNLNLSYKHSLTVDDRNSVTTEFYIKFKNEYASLLEIDTYTFKIELSNTASIDLALCLKGCYWNDSMTRDISFKFDMLNLNDLYELSLLVNQKLLYLYFIEPNDDMLNIRKEVEIEIDLSVIKKIRQVIDDFFYRNQYYYCKSLGTILKRKTVKLETLIQKSTHKIKNMDTIEIKYKYNWVDVAEYAEILFCNYPFEIGWTQDAWNIIMFNDIVKTNNIVKNEQSDYQKGDMLLWIQALYNLYYEYKVNSDLEYNDDTSRYRIFDEDNVDKYMGCYLKDEIIEELNEALMSSNAPKFEIYDSSVNNFVFEEGSIPLDVFISESENRNKLINKRIRAYFEDNKHLIFKFFSGNHWVENYSVFNEKRQKIDEKFNKITEKIKAGFSVEDSGDGYVFFYQDQYDVDKKWEEELEELDDEQNCYVNDLIDFYAASDVYLWIDQGMPI